MDKELFQEDIVISNADHIGQEDELIKATLTVKYSKTMLNKTVKQEASQEDIEKLKKLLRKQLEMVHGLIAQHIYSQFMAPPEVSMKFANVMQEFMNNTKKAAFFAINNGIQNGFTPDSSTIDKIIEKQDEED